MNPVAMRKHLDRLEEDSKLEKLLDAKVDHLPWADFAWAMQYPAMIGLIVQLASMAMAYRRDDRVPPTTEVVWALALALVTLALRFGWPLLRCPRERRLVQLRRHGQVIPAAIVQVNPMFYDDDNTEWCPGSLLVSADPQASANPELLRAAAERLGELSTQDRRHLPAEHGEIAWALYHEMVPLASIPVPAELAAGLHQCELVTVRVPPRPLSSSGTHWALKLAGDNSPDAVAILPSSVVP